MLMSLRLKGFNGVSLQTFVVHLVTDRVCKQLTTHTVSGSAFLGRQSKDDRNR